MRQRVLDAMPGTHGELGAKGGVSLPAVSRWLVDLLETKQAHIAGWRLHPTGGRPMPIYERGPAKSVTPKKPRVKTDTERVRAYRKRLRQSGEWEDRLALNRAKWRADHPAVNQHPLAAAFSNMIAPHGR